MGRILFYTALFFLFYFIVRAIRKSFIFKARSGNANSDINRAKPENRKPSQIDKNKVVDADYEDL